jgi:uncharacterized membrane protein YgdD (TMEM256/DUF423 family)
MRALHILAALAAALAIAAGAFAAHGMEGKAAEWLRTGGLYGLIHAVAVLVVAPRVRVAAWLLLVGSLIFSTTLYAMALGAPRFLGMVTPVGGLLMIAGWLWFAWMEFKR